MPRECAGCAGDDQTTPDAPFVVGAVNGAPATHVEFVIATFGRRAGERSWITGTETSTVLAFGFAVPVPGR